MTRTISRLTSPAALVTELARTREQLRDCRSLAETRKVVIDRHKDTIRAIEREVMHLEALVENYRRDVAALVATPIIAPPRREHMPDTRESIRWQLRVGANPHGIGAKVDIGLFPDGRVGEIFLRLDRTHRHGVGGAMADAAMTFLSLCLQWGAPLPELLSKLIGAADDSGGLTYYRPDPDQHEYVRDPQVPMVVSLRDYIGKKLRANTDDGGRWIGRARNEEDAA